MNDAPMDFNDGKYGECLHPSRPSPETEAMGQMLMDAINREIAVRAQLIEARRLLAEPK